MTRRSFGDPTFVALRSLLHLGEVKLVDKALARLWHDALHQLPNSEELTTGLEEQVLIQQSGIQQGARLFPVAHDHSGKRSALGAWSGDPHRIFNVLHVVVLE